MSGKAPESGTGPPPTDPPAAVQVPNASIHVFISYASQDSAVANTVVEALERHGAKCWIAPRDVVPGEFYAGAIVHAIDAANVIVLILSENAATSQHVLREVERASSKRHPVVAFRIELAPMPAHLEYFLNTSHWLDASAVGVEHALPKLIDAVQRLAAPTPAADPAHQAATAAPAAGLFPQLPKSTPARQRLSRPLTALVPVIAVIVAYFVVDRLWLAKPVASERPLVAVAPTAAPSAPAIPEKSIAVLPFADMSERHNQEYFSDGLSEELIDRLSQSDDLRVIARTSSFYFKAKQATVAEIGRTLNVSHVLEGSVRKNGNMVRITAQLVRSSDGSHVWSRTYDRKLVDILKVQDEIAGTVALALKAALASKPPAQQSEAASQAYNLILEGDFFFRRHEMGDPEHATDLYKQAMQVDPKNARARIAFAEAILHLAHHNIVPADTAARQAMEATQEALSIDPNFAPAHRLIAKIERDVNWNWTRALAELEQARSLPSSASDRRDVMLAIEYIRALKSGVYSKRYEDLLRDDLAADPLSGGTMDELATVLTADNRLQEALSLRSRSLQLSPNAMGGKAQLGLQLMYLKRNEDALSVAKTELSDFWKLRALACIHWAMAEHAESDRDLAEFAKHDPGSYFMANVHAFRGERDEAFKWLDRAYQEHSAYLPELNVDPILKSLRGDPRFRDLQVKLRLTD